MFDISKFIEQTSNFLYTYILIGLLVVLGLYFTIKTNFVQFRYFKEMFRVMVDGGTQKDGKGHVSSFQAFCISTASRVGTGNLAGIAIAISVGGPGAIFWMWLIALIGAASSFIESTLAQIYKQKDENGAFRGGPAYYIEKGLGKKWMGILFSILITISFGLIFNSVQSNTISIAINEAFGVSQLSVGIVLMIFTLIIIIGGVQRVAKVSGIIVPVMALLYMLVSLFVVVKNCTAFIILLSDIDLTGELTGIQLTQNALTSQIGNFGNTFIALCILLFAFSSIIGNYYYGESNIEFLTNNKLYINIYRVCVAAMVLFGSIASLDIVWNLADIFMAIMAIINLIAITLLGKFAFRALDDYREQKKAGIKDPVFKASSIEEFKNLELWK